MSAIDTVDHVHVATFCNVASVYWFNGTCNREDIVTPIYEPKTNQVLDSNYISIGGGSGEHPALIINIDHALYTLFDDMEYIHNPDWYIDKNEWDFNTFKNVSDYFNSQKNQSHEDISVRILKSVALLVLSELPLDHCIKNKHILKMAKNIEDYYLDWSDFIGFSGVLYSASYGRKTVNGKVIFKNTLHDWYKDNASI